MSASIAPCAIRAGVYPGVPPRIVVDAALAGRLDLSTERLLGTYELGDSQDVIATLEEARLLGRGGAGFPAHLKWRAVAAASGHKVVVANGEEGEPSSLKDRWLLTHRPHLVLDGLLLAARAVGATRAIVYLSHDETIESVRAALVELDGSDVQQIVPVEVHTVEPTYVAGDETAVCRSINGGPALPTAKPPRPFERGVDGAPTLVSNVETLAHAAWTARHGAHDYRRFGTDASPGTTLITLGGACRTPGVYEVPFGKQVGELFETVGGGFTSAPRGFAMGGWFGGLLSAARGDLACCYAAVRAAGSGLGCGAITTLGEADDPLAFAADVAAWYARESAQQCGVCVKGTAAIAKTMTALNAGAATGQDRENLIRWGATLPGRGACAFLDGAAALARTLMSEFEADTTAKIKLAARAALDDYIVIGGRDEGSL